MKENDTENNRGKKKRLTRRFVITTESAVSGRTKRRLRKDHNEGEWSDVLALERGNNSRPQVQGRDSQWMKVEKNRPKEKGHGLRTRGKVVSLRMKNPSAGET